MPLVMIEVIKGALGERQKRELIERVTDAMIAVKGEDIRALTSIRIREMRACDWTGGGWTVHSDIEHRPAIKAHVDEEAGTERAADLVRYAF